MSSSAARARFFSRVQVRFQLQLAHSATVKSKEEARDLLIFLQELSHSRTANSGTADTAAATIMMEELFIVLVLLLSMFIRVCLQTVTLTEEVQFGILQVTHSQ